MKYAIVETGGKQYRVQEGETLQVERLSGEAGDTVQLDKVLLVATDEGIKVGQPYVEDASVTAEILEHGKGEKVIAFRYKAKKNVRRRRGHRQPYTALKIVGINASGNEA